jgi:succinylglutamate desuccinylase
MKQDLKEIKTIDSKKAGPTVTIMGGVHGNEPCGVKTLLYLIENLELISGKVNLIFGNPKAIEKKVRYIDTNLNRIFKEDKDLSQKEKESYEYSRSREIIPYLIESDVLIDLHSISSKETNPFVICNEDSLSLAKHLPVSICCHGFDSIEPGATEYFIYKNKKMGVCIECGFHEKDETFQFALNSVNILLSKLGMISTDINYETKHDQKILKADYIYKTKTDEFRVAKKFKNFEPISAGQHIATDGDEKIFSNCDQYIVFADDRNEVGGEGFIYLKDVYIY